MLDLQENIHKQVKNTSYMSAGFPDRHAVGFGDLSIDVCLESKIKQIVRYCI